MNRTLMLACLSVALVSLMLSALAAQGAGLTGRFFYTPEERATLDRLRIDGEHSQRVRRNESSSVTEASTPNPVLTFKGIVLRSSGKRTIWINDRLYNEDELPPGIRAPSWSERGDPAVEMIGRDGSFTLKPGQILMPNRSPRGEERR